MPETDTAVHTDISAAYIKVRARTLQIVHPLEKEDYVVQPIADVSPPKWHLGHTTWFFETFILKPHFEGYTLFNKDFDFVFNSYYETLGARVIRTDRGNLSRPTVDEIFSYRRYVDDAMVRFLTRDQNDEIVKLLLLGLNHEEQHQELLLTDIKYILGHNPLFPVYSKTFRLSAPKGGSGEFIQFKEGVYNIGAEINDAFVFDNELNRHKVYLHDFEISKDLVTNGEYLRFMEDNGYKDFRHWHADGWNWVKHTQAKAPLYWHNIDGKWHNYDYGGLAEIDLDAPVGHINYYEAYAFASWKGMRLPTEFEWEAAAGQLPWGKRWEWTESAYLPYPGYTKAEGAIGEYNGKFMVGQQILRGASELTSPGHSRRTYRNFFPPATQWQLTGIRLAKTVML